MLSPCDGILHAARLADVNELLQRTSLGLLTPIAGTRTGNGLAG
jgi:ABC-type protease/lipase transport system fused ATPase/permease subunit